MTALDYSRWEAAEREATRILAEARSKYAFARNYRAQQAPGQAPATLPPGSLFGVPGFTQPTEQRDNNDGASFTLATATQTDLVAAGVTNFKQTDVVTWWELDLAITQTFTAGTSVLTASAYAPLNWPQQMVLSIQNLFKPLEVVNGIDAAIFQVLRPMRQQPYGQNLLFASPFGTSGTAFGSWQATGIGQSNLVSSEGWTTATTAQNLTYELPASIYFDYYFHLDKNGNPVAGVAQPQRCIVSPVYMAGSARYVQPQIKFAAGSVANLDTGPVNIGAGTGTFSGSVKLAGVRRVGFYGSNNLQVLPPVMNPWQYRRMSVQFGIGGKTFVDIPLQAVSQPGQIGIIFIRMWDPAANGGLGAPIAITNLNRCQIQYGSGQLRFDDQPLQAQRRILEQHNVLLPGGVLAWDFWMDLYGRITNAQALNTLTTAGVNIHLEFASAVSSTAYIVVGTELLVVVE